MDKIEKMNSIMNYIHHRCTGNKFEHGSFYDIKTISNEEEEYDMYARFVPRNYDIEDLPKIKEAFKNLGLDMNNEFKQNWEDDNVPYRDYHECYFFINEKFNEFIPASELITAYYGGESNDQND